MNISYNWLESLIQSGLTPQQLGERLTAAGCEVSEIHDLPGGDHQLIAEVTSNRPDWLCHYGIAREVSALTGKPFALPAPSPNEVGTPITEQVKVEVQDKEGCPRYTARLIKGVTVKPSPNWLRARIESIGLRPVNNVVDVTNYILFEMNQPLHAFDFNKLQGEQIIVRRAQAGEKLSALDGTDCALSPEMLVIADAQQPVAIAGVMGGASSEVGNATTNILLESAYFAPALVRRTSRKLKLLSDSSFRYERGIDIEAVARASARACELILQVAGGELAPGIIDTNPEAGAPWEVTMRFAYCNRILGCMITPEEARRAFTGLGLYIISEDTQSIRVSVPAFRRDLTREIDLIEEAVRIIGFTRVPEKITMPVARAHVMPLTSGLRILRQALAMAGYHECVTDPFVPEKWQDNSDAVRIENPVDSSRPVMRRSLIPSLLDVRRINRQESAVQLFEINRIYSSTDGHKESLRLAILDDRGVEYVRGGLEQALRSLRLRDGALRICKASANGIQRLALNNETSACLSLGETELGLMGLVTQAAAKRHDLETTPAVLEIDLNTLTQLPREDRIYQPLPRFPGIRRDLALVVAEEVRWQQIEEHVLPELPNPETLRLESIYRGKGLDAGEKSVAFSFVTYAPDRTLTDDEANALRDKLVHKLTTAFVGAHLR